MNSWKWLIDAIPEPLSRPFQNTPYFWKTDHSSMNAGPPKFRDFLYFLSFNIHHFWFYNCSNFFHCMVISQKFRSVWIHLLIIILHQSCVEGVVPNNKKSQIHPEKIRWAPFWEIFFKKWKIHQLQACIKQWPWTLGND